MIEINLLPVELKQAQLRERRQGPVKVMLLVGVLTSLAAIVVLTAMMLGGRDAAHAISQRRDYLSPDYEQVLAARRRVEQLRAVEALYASFSRNPLLWSKKLNAISDSVPIGLWLRFLSLEQRMAMDAAGKQTSLSYLRIEGTVYSAAREELTVIREFTHNLRAQDNFSSVFSAIDMEGLVRRQQATREVMDFTLLCYLKEGITLR